MGPCAGLRTGETLTVVDPGAQNVTDSCPHRPTTAAGRDLDKHWLPLAGNAGPGRDRVALVPDQNTDIGRTHRQVNAEAVCGRCDRPTLVISDQTSDKRPMGFRVIPQSSSLVRIRTAPPRRMPASSSTGLDYSSTRRRVRSHLLSI